MASGPPPRLGSKFGPWKGSINRTRFALGGSRGKGLPTPTPTPRGFLEENFCKVTHTYLRTRTKRFISFTLKSLFTSAEQQVGIILRNLHQLRLRSSQSSETASTAPDGCQVRRKSSWRLQQLRQISQERRSVMSGGAAACPRPLKRELVWWKQAQSAAFVRRSAM